MKVFVLRIHVIPATVALCHERAKRRSERDYVFRHPAQEVRSPGQSSIESRLGGAPRQCRYDGSRLRIESLEDRRMLSVSPLLAAIHSSASSAASTPPAITLHVQPGTSYYGRSVLMTAKVPGATGGTVEFLDGTTLLDTATPFN